MIGTLVVVILASAVAFGYLLAQLERTLNERESHQPRERRIAKRSASTHSLTTAGSIGNNRSRSLRVPPQIPAGIVHPSGTRPGFPRSRKPW